MIPLIKVKWILPWIFTDVPEEERIKDIETQLDNWV